MATAGKYMVSDPLAPEGAMVNRAIGDRVEVLGGEGLPTDRYDKNVAGMTPAELKKPDQPTDDGHPVLEPARSKLISDDDMIPPEGERPFGEVTLSVADDPNAKPTEKGEEATDGQADRNPDPTPEKDDKDSDAGKQDSADASPSKTGGGEQSSRGHSSLRSSRSNASADGKTSTRNR